MIQMDLFKKPLSAELIAESRRLAPAFFSRLDPKNETAELFLDVLLDEAEKQNKALDEAKRLGKPIPSPYIDLTALQDISSPRGTYLRFLSESPSIESSVTKLRKAGWPIRKSQGYRYEAHHKTCPKCKSAAPLWSGLKCRNEKCGYQPRCFRSTPQNITRIDMEKKIRIEDKGERKSNRFYPAVRLMPKFDLLIVDEFHNVVSLRSIHGQALFDFPCDKVLLLSGTIARTYIHELEAALSMVHDPNSPEFPYARYNLSDFKEQYCSYSEKRSTVHDRTGNLISNRLVNRSLLPEASNLNSLRRLLHSRMVGVEESVVDAEWNLPNLPERTVYFDLNPDEENLYRSNLAGILNWREELLNQIRSSDYQVRATGRRNYNRGIVSRLEILAETINGRSKVRAATDWAANECVNAGLRGIIVCRSVALYRHIRDSLKEANIPFEALDESVANEDRAAFLQQFRDSGKPILLTRIKLVCESFNEMVCCSRLLFAQVEHSPAANRQMQKRINRPGQLSRDLRCDFLVARSPSWDEATLDEIEIRRFLRREAAINELRSRNTDDHKRRSHLAIQMVMVHEQRGISKVLEDLANKAKSEYSSKAIVERTPTLVEIPHLEVQSSVPVQAETPKESSPVVDVTDVSSPESTFATAFTEGFLFTIDDTPLPEKQRTKRSAGPRRKQMQATYQEMALF